MHSECYDKLEQVLLRHMETLPGNRRTFENLRLADKIKSIWNLKYDMVRPKCRCACGQGYLRAEVLPNSTAVRRVGDDTTTREATAAEERRAKIEAAMKAKAQHLAEAKAREREEKAREREEARQRNLLEKAEREQRKIEREKEREERANLPPAPPSASASFNWGAVAPEAQQPAEFVSPAGQYVPYLQQRRDGAAPLPVLPPPAPRPAPTFDLGNEAFPTLGHPTSPPASVAGASSNAFVGSDAPVSRADGVGPTTDMVPIRSNVPASSREACPVCLAEHAADVQLEPCGHCLCANCLVGWSHEQSSYAATARRASSVVTCPICRQPATSAPTVAKSAISMADAGFRVQPGSTNSLSSTPARPSSSLPPPPQPTVKREWPKKRHVPGRTVLEMPYQRLDPTLGSKEHVAWVAALIGKKGATIQAMQNVSGATIHIQKVSEVPDGATVRLIEIKGTAKQREAGEQAVIARLSQIQQVHAVRGCEHA